MAFKNPFKANSKMGFVVDSVLSSIPNTEMNMFKVRKEKTADKKYGSMKLVSHADLLRLYSDKKSKTFECVLHPAGTNTDAYSLFRLTSEEDAQARFILLHQYLHPFFRATPGLYHVTVLQKLSDLARQSAEFSPAHLAVLTQLNDSLKSPEVYKHVNSQNCPDKKTPLLLAVEISSVESVVQLVECGARVDIVDDNGDNLYHYTARLTTTGGQMMQTLPKHKEVMDQPNKAGQTPILVACQIGNFDVAVALAKAGAAVDLTDEVGYPIHYALKKCHEETAKAIFQRHQDYGKLVCTKHGGTPLHWAKSVEFIKLVLKQNYDLDATSKSGDTALSVMIKRQRETCALALLTAGADPNKQDNEGNTPLHHVVHRKELPMVHTLIAFGANVNVLNNKGESPRHLAATDVLNTIGGMMGMNSEMIFALHEVGAERCLSGAKGCQGGCKFGGQYNGTPPNKTQKEPLDAGERVYDKYLDDCIDGMCLGAPTQKQTVGVDSVDGAMETDGDDPSQRRSLDSVLCLDGGGIRGLVLTQMLAAIEKASGRRITEMFDWIVGTSTGGILAIALSQGYTVEECRKIYMSFKDEVFKGGRPYKSANLEQFLQQTFGEDTTLDKYKYPRILVSGTLGDRSPPALHFFRNFEAPETSSASIAANSPPFQPVPKPSEQLAWRAARSSGAAPTYFQPMGRFLDGGLIANNPTLDALTEIHEFYMYKKAQGEPVRKLGAVVSVGTGLLPLKPISHVEMSKPSSVIDVLGAARTIAGGANFLDILVEQVCDARMRAVDRARAWCHSIGTPFFRFNPPLSSDISMDETRDPVLLRMLYDVERYIHIHRNRLQQMTDVINSL